MNFSLPLLRQEPLNEYNYIKVIRQNIKYTLVTLLTFLYVSCNSEKEKATTYPDIHIVGAMKNIMWKGELASRVNFDTIQNKTGLYGLGPESFLTGEVLINDGKSYISQVTSDSTMAVTKTWNASAPFFVYANVTEWNNIELPDNIKTIRELETFIDQKTTDYKRPFAFKLEGTIANATIHIQNLPKGTQVSSPDEAHQGQVNYRLIHDSVTIVGFFSTKHQGIFTHHDSMLHMHLITQDESKMGHLDELEINTMTLYLPKK